MICCGVCGDKVITTVSYFCFMRLGTLTSVIPLIVSLLRSDLLKNCLPLFRGGILFSYGTRHLLSVFLLSSGVRWFVGSSLYAKIRRACHLMYLEVFVLCGKVFCSIGIPSCRWAFSICQHSGCYHVVLLECQEMKFCCHFRVL